MVYSVEIESKGGPVWRGMFYTREAAMLLSATDAELRGGPFSVGASQVAGWGQHGLFPLEKSEYGRPRGYTNFGGLITSRMVALLRSYGVPIDRIARAVEYLKETTGDPFPFASQRLWVEAPEQSRQVYAELDPIIVTASRSGQLPFTELLYSHIGGVADMEFDDESPTQSAVKWSVSDDVVIDPLVQSGSTCLAGTRTPTRALYGSFVAGESIDVIAESYQLEEAQVEAAIQWESRLLEV